MTLMELGEEYLRQELVVRKRIAQLRPALKTARGEEHRALESRIGLLYAMARDCRHTGDYLKFYYGGDCNGQTALKS